MVDETASRLGMSHEAALRPAPAGVPRSAAFRIACWPRSSGNAYQAEFYAALRPSGVEVLYPPVIDDAWLRTTKRSVDALHMHWPESLWRTRGRSWLGHLRGIVGLERFLQAAKRKLKLIWTVHNLEPHESPSRLDRLGYSRLARHADLLIVHSRVSCEQLRAAYRPRGRVVMMYHGSYARRPVPREDHARLRRQFGLEHRSPLGCCVGNLREYKCFDLAVAAVRRMSRDFRLVVAGAPHPDFDLLRMSQLSAGDPRIRLIPRRLTDAEFDELVSLSTAVLLPYRKITSSGALLFALARGRSVIASDLPYFREICAPEPEAATFFAPGDSAGLARAIERHLEIPEPRRCAAALRLSAHYAWDRCIPPVAAVLQQWVRQKQDPSGDTLLCPVPR